MEPVQISKELDAVLDNWTDLQADVRSAFGEFIQDVVATDESEFELLHLYQCPTGSFSTNGVAHVLHWPPWKPKNPRHGSIGRHPSSSFSLKLLSTAFVKFQEHFSVDIYCRERRSHVNGERQTAEQLYGKDPNLAHHYALAETCISSLEAPSAISPVIIVYGQPAKRFFLSTFDPAFKPSGPYFSQAGSTIDIKGRTWSVVFVPHPEYLRRWATSVANTAFEATLTSLQQSHGIEINFEAMKMVASGSAGDVSSYLLSSEIIQDSEMDPTFEEEATKVVQSTWTPAVRDAKAAASKRRWDDPEYFKRCLAALRKRRTEYLGVEPSNVVKFKCYMTGCDKVYSQKQRFPEHFRDQHPETKYNPKLVTLEEPENPSGKKARADGGRLDPAEVMIKYECPECEELFDCIKQCRDHHHRKHAKIKWDFKKMEVVTVKQQRVPGKFQLRCPLQSTTNPLEPCKETRGDSGGIKKHVERAHERSWAKTSPGWIPASQYEVVQTFDWQVLERTYKDGRTVQESTREIKSKGSKSDKYSTSDE